jgi:hypothetical protein
LVRLQQPTAAIRRVAKYRFFAMADELPALRLTEIQRSRARQVGVCVPVEFRKIARKVLTFRHGFL